MGAYKIQYQVTSFDNNDAQETRQERHFPADELEEALAFFQVCVSEGNYQVVELGKETYRTEEEWVQRTLFTWERLLKIETL